MPLGLLKISPILLKLMKNQQRFCPQMTYFLVTDNSAILNVLSKGNHQRFICGRQIICKGTRTRTRMNMLTRKLTRTLMQAPKALRQSDNEIYTR